MKRALMIVALVVPLTVIALGFREYDRCKRHDLPSSLPLNQLSGSVAPLLERIGQPDRRYLTTANEIYREGIDGLAVPDGSLGSSASQQREVLLWKRTCFGFRTRSLSVVLSPSSQEILYWDTPARGGALPVIVLGPGDDKTTSRQRTRR